MPERKRGFQGLEQRIQQMHDEDEKRERQAQEEQRKEAPRTEPGEEKAGKPER